MNMQCFCTQHLRKWSKDVPEKPWLFLERIRCARFHPPRGASQADPRLTPSCPCLGDALCFSHHLHPRPGQHRVQLQVLTGIHVTHALSASVFFSAVM